MGQGGGLVDSGVASISTNSRASRSVISQGCTGRPMSGLSEGAHRSCERQPTRTPRRGARRPTAGLRSRVGGSRPTPAGLRELAGEPSRPTPPLGGREEPIWLQLAAGLAQRPLPAERNGGPNGRRCREPERREHRDQPHRHRGALAARPRGVSRGNANPALEGPDLLVERLDRRQRDPVGVDRGDVARVLADPEGAAEVLGHRTDVADRRPLGAVAPLRDRHRAELPEHRPPGDRRDRGLRGLIGERGPGAATRSQGHPGGGRPVGAVDRAHEPHAARRADAELVLRRGSEVEGRASPPTRRHRCGSTSPVSQRRSFQRHSRCWTNRRARRIVARWRCSKSRRPPWRCYRSLDCRRRPRRYRTSQG